MLKPKINHKKNDSEAWPKTLESKRYERARLRIAKFDAKLLKILGQILIICKI
ncbi:hypothetical protein [Dapis sp. BLCC M172]|uniref:hypothetical protein n=1 Tax=Dapis sp. BLCC M172 TaxID=2975281 RepID=UPI003CFB08FD